MRGEFRFPTRALQFICGWRGMKFAGFVNLACRNTQWASVKIPRSAILNWCQSTFLMKINESFKATTKAPSHQASKERPKVMPIFHLFIALGVFVVMHLRLVDCVALAAQSSA
jgi:hypothetical protein